MNATKKQAQKFEHSHRFSIVSNNQIPDSVVAAPYLRKVNGEFELLCLGRNGEPFAKRPVKVSCKDRLREGGRAVKLTTNKDGVLKLGPLHDVEQLCADTTNTQI